MSARRDLGAEILRRRLKFADTPPGAFEMLGGEEHRLLAAAPDLLAALQAIAALPERDERMGRPSLADAVTRARTALSKALGEGE